MPKQRQRAAVRRFLEVVSWKFVEFAYERSVRPPLETITAAWDDALIDAHNAGGQEDPRKAHRQSA
jgi:hypothetical protein